MKTQWMIGIFVAGIILGWLIPRDVLVPDEKTGSSELPGKSERKRQDRAAVSAHPSKWQTVANQLANGSDEERSTFRDSLKPEDRAGLIEAILSRSGPDGLDENSKSFIHAILNLWANDDFETAWAWSQQLAGGANRKFMAEKLLAAFVEKEPKRAMELYQTMVADFPDFGYEVPMALLKKAAGTGATDYLDILNKIPPGSPVGTDMKFSETFDFQLVADRLSQTGKDQMPRVLPTNFISSWAQRAPDAAYAWFAKNDSVAFNDFGSLLEGIEKQGAPGSAQQWAVAKLEESGAPRKKMIDGLRDNYGPSSAKINAIALAMPDTVSRDRFYKDVFVEAFGVYDPIQQLGFTISGMSSPEVRLQALQDYRTLGRRISISEFTDSQLQAWGITREQLGQAYDR